MGIFFLLLNYDVEVLVFYSYEFLVYNGGQDCFDGMMSFWLVYEFDVYVYFGKFSLILLFNDVMLFCVEMDEVFVVIIGMVCFDVKQQGSVLEISFDVVYIFFNS